MAVSVASPPGKNTSITERRTWMNTEARYFQRLATWSGPTRVQGRDREPLGPIEEVGYSAAWPTLDLHGSPWVR